MPAARPEPFSDPDQPILFDELPVPPPKRSDRNAVADIEEVLETLGKMKTLRWSPRLLGWQRHRFAAWAKLLTPIEAAAATAQFEAELDRLGPPYDFWADEAGG